MLTTRQWRRRFLTTSKIAPLSGKEEEVCFDSLLLLLVLLFALSRSTVLLVSSQCATKYALSLW